MSADRPSLRQVLTGIAASPGIAIGKVVVFDRNAVPVRRRHVDGAAVDGEVARLEAAVAAARQEIELAMETLPAEAGADHRLLLETQRLMLSDALLLDNSRCTIRDERVGAEWALRQTVDAMRARLHAAPEAYFRERADDVGAVGEYLLRVLTGASRSLPTISEPAIVVARDISPAEAAQLLNKSVLGIVTASGTASGHTAILARALEVPALVGVREVTRSVGPGEMLILDALRGEATVLPDDDELADAVQRAERFQRFRGRLRDSERRAAQTSDGVRISLLANVDLELDVAMASGEGADGIGLYRTEFLYLDRSVPPSEEEQLATYRRVARKFAPRSVTFRTFDLGADKMPGAMRRGPGSPLGLRALRIAFEQPELLVTQLRALLRASVEGNLRVMFPMVAGVADLRRARVLFERARADLDAEGSAYGPITIGAMLEVPSAILMADQLAKECDFFSLGTNDLTQYTLAVDRNDPRVAHLASPLEPAVLRLVESARRVAAAHGVDLSVCGDLAADPVGVPILLGLGLTRLSMPMAAIPLVREVVSRLDASELVALANEALGCATASDVERLVAERLGDTLGDLFEGEGIELPR
ncbi:MAG: phosphoenolpyruvate--protein phosphotransferase [Sandaracinaceae bacterium]